MGAQIVGALQTVVSRQIDITKVPAIVTIGAFQGGLRSNIISDSAVMLLSICTFDQEMRNDIFRKITSIATHTALASDTTASVMIDSGYHVTRNHVDLTKKMWPTLQRAAGASGVIESGLVTGS